MPKLRETRAPPVRVEYERAFRLTARSRERNPSFVVGRALTQRNPSPPPSPAPAPAPQSADDSAPARGGSHIIGVRGVALYPPHRPSPSSPRTDESARIRRSSLRRTPPRARTSNPAVCQGREGKGQGAVLYSLHVIRHARHARTNQKQRAGQRFRRGAKTYGSYPDALNPARPRVPPGSLYSSALWTLLFIALWLPLLIARHVHRKWYFAVVRREGRGEGGIAGAAARRRGSSGCSSEGWGVQRRELGDSMVIVRASRSESLARMRDWAFSFEGGGHSRGRAGGDGGRGCAQAGGDARRRGRGTRACEVDMGCGGTGGAEVSSRGMRRGTAGARLVMERLRVRLSGCGAHQSLGFYTTMAQQDEARTRAGRK
ncbi:hypothetical protein DFH09DRAFT_1096546 [Mycena vulgaris]|nr:hypothetical protein DFH09DRAFT_1096546 [Mycena vulgaris]